MTKGNFIKVSRQRAASGAVPSEERSDARGTKNIILAAGGTGGHVFTAIAIAEELQKRGYNILFSTDKRGEKYLKDKSFTYKIITSGSPGGGIFTKLAVLAKLSTGVLQSFIYLAPKRPKLVIGFGGYPTFPPLIAARLLGIKTILHEQNSVLGKVNRVLAKSAAAVATAFPETKFATNPIYTGQPVRNAITSSPYPATTDKIHILITGGSQGAKLFADILPEALCQFADKISVVHQVPDNKIAQVKKQYQACGIEFVIQSFFNDMQERLSAAHLLIARAGSATVFELATTGRPAIFVPLKIAADNHQFHNTEAICKSGGSWMIEEKDFNVTRVSAIIAQILADPQKLTLAAENIKKFAKPNAASELADLAEKIINK